MRKTIEENRRDTEPKKQITFWYLTTNWWVSTVEIATYPPRAIIPCIGTTPKMIPINKAIPCLKHYYEFKDQENLIILKMINHEKKQACITVLRFIFNSWSFWKAKFKSRYWVCELTFSHEDLTSILKIYQAMWKWR